MSQTKSELTLQLNFLGDSHPLSGDLNGQRYGSKALTGSESVSPRI